MLNMVHPVNITQKLFVNDNGYFRLHDFKLEGDCLIEPGIKVMMADSTRSRSGVVL